MLKPASTVDIAALSQRGQIGGHDSVFHAALGSRIGTVYMELHLIQIETFHQVEEASLQVQPESWKIH